MSKDLLKLFEIASFLKKETKRDVRRDGLVCRRMFTRSISVDKYIKWEDKYYEAYDKLGYKELGSEKSGCGLLVLVLSTPVEDKPFKLEFTSFLVKTGGCETVIGFVLLLALIVLGTFFASLEVLSGLIQNNHMAITLSFFTTLDSCGVETEFEVIGFDKACVSPILGRFSMIALFLQLVDKRLLLPPKQTPTEDYNAKLCVSTQVVGTNKYAAPEYIDTDTDASSGQKQPYNQIIVVPSVGLVIAAIMDSRFKRKNQISLRLRLSDMGRPLKLKRFSHYVDTLDSTGDNVVKVVIDVAYICDVSPIFHVLAHTKLLLNSTSKDDAKPSPPLSYESLKEASSSSHRVYPDYKIQEENSADENWQKCQSVVVPDMSLVRQDRSLLHVAQEKYSCSFIFVLLKGKNDGYEDEAIKKHMVAKGNWIVHYGDRDEEAEDESH
nr:zeta toxin domain, P-loop containing nucleoside triphosphate hydrolase [Tanacetum cinerariifolium]